MSQIGGSVEKNIPRKTKFWQNKESTKNEQKLGACTVKSFHS
jgi:hypothetical protein